MSNTNQLNLAKFAFNIYGTLNTQSESSLPSSTNSSKSRYGYFNPNARDNLIFNSDKELSCLTDLELIPNSGFNNNVVIGGKNYLKLLILSNDQSSILNEANILEPQSSSNSRLPGSNKLNNFNTIKSYKNTIAGGMVNGTVNLYQVLNNGKSRLLRKYTDHKRCINSLDFLDPMNNDTTANLLISGSQDGSIKLWDLRLASDKPVVNVLPKSNYDSVRSCQFSSHSAVRNKMVILSVHDSGTLNKYDIRSLSSQAHVVPERKWNFHTGPALSLNIHPEKEYVITCGRDQRVCVWNYGENQNSYSSTTPEYVLNTYGPVMKVRWCPYPNSPMILDADEDDVSYDDKDLNAHQNPLFDYDFACLYLNEDPTITVYNLNRRYVPKEIVNSFSSRPYQNFIWARNPTNQRKLWTLTKGNQFSSRTLDSRTDPEISRPQQILNPVSMDWGTSIGELSFISQEKSDFENNQLPDKHNLEYLLDPLDSDVVGSDADSDYNLVVIGSTPTSNLQNPGLPPRSFSATSPIETTNSRQLFRASTFANNSSLTPKLSNASPQIKNLSQSIQDSPIPRRPSLGRNPSQTTIESSLSVSSPLNKMDVGAGDIRKAIQVYHSSPYIVPVSLPLPLNDDIVFETLSNNYLLTVPDGFSLVDVCLMNAGVAASVNRFRDCQVWRMLAVGLEQHVDEFFGDEILPGVDNEDNGTEADTNNDNKSISSEYGIVGSYNSNSTNFEIGSELTSEKKSMNPNSWGDNKNSSTNNLMDLINQSRSNSIVNSINATALSPGASRSNSMINHVSNLRLTAYKAEENEHAVVDDDDEEDNVGEEPKDTSKGRDLKVKAKLFEQEDGRSASENKLEYQRKNKSNDASSVSPEEASNLIRRYSSVPNMSPNKDEIRVSISPTKRLERVRYGTSPKNSAVLGKLKLKRDSSITSSYIKTKPEDLDNENVNMLSGGNSLSSSAVSTVHTLDNRSSLGSLPSNYYGSFKSRRSSSIAPTYGFLNSKSYDNDLAEVEETISNNSSRINETAVESGLTRAIEEDKDNKKQADLEIPWTISNLLEKALNHATLQGDVILCSTLSLLFYPFVRSLSLKIIRKDFCLQWVSLYIEILHRKRLFVNATNILNIVPREFHEKLGKFYYCDTVKLYCEHCNELLVNEEAKHKFNNGELKKFGYWFCEKCKKNQLNCVYCNEPCVGLNVVASLKCGHRGHFGCFKEWFIEDANAECPAGCSETITV